jgi:glycerol-3-phosphate acyltransferase PlsY
MLDLGLRLLVSYLLGSLMGALIIGRLSGGGDIRAEGSGNAGGTNALRTRGASFALGVVLIDIGKGVLAATLVATAPLPWSPAPLTRETVALLCAGAAVLGHIFPYWYGFRGGKGAATLVGAYAALSPLLLVPVLLAFALSLTLTGFVGLSTMIAAASAAIASLVMAPGASSPAVTWFACAMAALLVYTHRSNIARMLRREEDRKRRVMLFRRSHGES